MAILHTLYDTVPGSPASKLFADYTAGTSTSITLEDGNIAPEPPNIITVMTEDKSQFATVRYDDKANNVLSSLTVIRGDGIIFEAGHAIAVRNYTYEDDSGIKGDIIDHEGRIETLESSTVNAVAGVKVGGTELQKDAENKVNIPVGSDSVLGVVKSGAEAVISSDGSIDISTATDRLETAINTVSGDLSDHVDDKNNPHEVTKAQVGLGSVDNTADLDKPISTAVQAALDEKGDDDVLQEHISDTDNPHEVDKTDVGLGNADNTSDLDKPISTATQAALDAKADATGLSSHIADTGNPHSVTKSQVGLSNADNTTDLDKPVSTATQTALNSKASVSDLTDHISDTNNPHEVTKAQVGLGNADNTADLNKPISTATQSALDLKASITYVDTALEDKVDKVTGKGLSTNDFTDAYKQKIDDADSGLSDHIADTSNPHSVTKSQVGLGSVDNTADMDKPVSTATSAALALKADATDLSDHVSDTTNPHSVTKAQVGLGNVDNTADADKPVSTATQTALNGKVDKVTGKGLSTNDFTDTYKGKIETTESGLASHVADTDNPHEVTATQLGVEEGAEVNVLEGIVIGGADVAITNKKSTIPPATTSSLGVIKVGTNLSVSADGTLSATGGELSQIPADWAQTDSTQPDFIKNKPTLGTASALDVAASGNAGTGQVVKGNDTRLTDSRTPTSHASTHYGSGADAIPNVTQTTNGLMSSADKTKLNGIEAQAQKNVQSDWDAVSGDSLILNKPTTLSEFSNDENFQTDTQVASSISTHNSSTTAHSDIRGLISSEVSRAEGEEQSLQDQIDALASRTDVADVVASHADLDLTKYLVNDIVKVMQDETRGGAITYYKVVETAGVKSWQYVGSQGPFYTKTEADGYFVPQQRTVNGQALSNNVSLGASDVGALPDDTTLADLSGDSTHRVVTDAQISSWNAKSPALTFDETPTEDSTNPVYSGGVYDGLAAKADSTDLTAHTSNTSNPHSVTKSQVGLGNVDNTSDANKPVSTATATALAGKVDKVEGKGLSTNDYTTAEKNKLSEIEAGAQVNVQADWTATTAATGAIKNKPTLGGAAALDVGTTAGTVCAGNDSRLTNARAPTSHASTHAAGGSDAITPASIGAEPAISKATAFNKNFGTEEGTVCEGDDSRLSNARTPTAHASSHGSSGTDPITPSAIGAEPAFSKGTAFNKNFGSASGTVCEGNDSRLMTSAERTKLEGIEAGAEVNVQANWTQTTSTADDFIKNKPTLGTASAKDVPASGNASSSQVVLGSDTRLTNARTPSAHASSHGSSGNDPITPASIGAEPAFTKNNAFNKNFGTDSGTVCQGNDSRLSNARTPTAHASTHYGTGTDAIPAATTSSDGLMSASDKTKLNGIASGAEVNVQSDWNATSGDAFIQNKPTLGTASAKDVPASGNASSTQVVLGSDTRLSDARTPTSHNHAASNITSGTLDAARLPAATASALGGIKVGTGLSVSSGTVSVSYGSASGTACQGNDSRLSDARTPTSHASTATTYGVASASNYGHPKATSATPADLGTASVGTDNGLYARGDHVHRDWKHISTADPTASDGVNGDVWFKYEE